MAHHPIQSADAGAEVAVPATVPAQREDLDVLREITFYNRYLHGRVGGWYGSRIWEAGAGTGNMAEGFPPGRLVLATEYEAQFLDILRDRLRGRRETTVEYYDLLERPERYASLGLDTAVTFNVVEHIEDDVAALRNLADPLVPGGRVIVLVPAGQWAFGALDRAIGHYRRYDRQTLGAALAGAGLEVEKLFYLNLPGAFGWFWNSVALKRRTLPRTQARVFDRVFRIWAPLEESLHLPLGLSVVGIGRKAE